MSSKVGAPNLSIHLGAAAWAVYIISNKSTCNLQATYQRGAWRAACCWGGPVGTGPEVGESGIAHAHSLRMGRTNAVRLGWVCAGSGGPPAARVRWHLGERTMCSVRGRPGRVGRQDVMRRACRTPRDAAA